MGDDFVIVSHILDPSLSSLRSCVGGIVCHLFVDRETVTAACGQLYSKTATWQVAMPLCMVRPVKSCMNPLPCRPKGATAMDYGVVIVAVVDLDPSTRSRLRAYELIGWDFSRIDVCPFSKPQQSTGSLGILLQTVDECGRVSQPWFTISTASLPLVRYLLGHHR